MLAAWQRWKGGVKVLTVLARGVKSLWVRGMGCGEAGSGEGGLM